MNNREKTALKLVANEVRVPWTANGVLRLAEALNRDREDIDLLVEVIAALEAFSEVIRVQTGQHDFRLDR